MNEVLSNPDLLRAILRAESLRAKHVARAELVCTASAFTLVPRAAADAARSLAARRRSG